MLTILFCSNYAHNCPISTCEVSENEFKIISTTFKKQAKNGQIQRKDFIKVMTKHGGMGEELANQLFDSFDTDNSGYVFFWLFLPLQSDLFRLHVQNYSIQNRLLCRPFQSKPVLAEGSVLRFRILAVRSVFGPL